MLDEDIVLKHRDLGAITVLPHHHDPFDGLTPGEELSLREDGRAPASGLTTLTSALLLRLQPCRALEARDVVASPRPRFAHPRRGARRVVPVCIIARAPTAATATAAHATFLPIAVGVARVPGLPRATGVAGVAGIVLCAVGILISSAATAATSAATATAATALVGVVLASVTGVTGVTGASTTINDLGVCLRVRLLGLLGRGPTP